MTRIALKLLNGIYGWIVGAAIVASAVYAGYSIWDNFQIYEAAEDVQNQIRELKPDEEAKGGPSFDELRTLNSDVVGWITLDGTNVDYPIVQGDTNLTYMDRDVYGEFSLAGSIFLDTRNSADFSDKYSLVYGHNMDKHLMFGDLAEYKDKEFFQKNTTATLMIPGESRKMDVLAVLQIPAGLEEIFNPDMWGTSLDGLAEWLEKNAIWYHSDQMILLKTETSSVQIVALVTCSDGSTNDRTVLILIRRLDSDQTDKVPSSDDVVQGRPKKTGDSQDPKFWIWIIAITIAIIFMIEGAERYAKKHIEKD